MSKTTADKLVDQREDQQNQEHSDYLKQVSERSYSNSPSVLRAERLKEELEKEAAAKQAADNPSWEHRRAAAEQRLTNLRAQYASQNSPLNFKVIPESERITLEMIKDAEKEVGVFYPEQKPRVFPTVESCKSAYLKPEEPLGSIRPKTPGVCETCGAEVEDCSIGIDRKHKNSDNDPCIINWGIAIKSGIRKPVQAQNLGIEPWASHPPYPEIS